MPYSYDKSGSKTSGDTISVPFPFISRDHVYVSVDGTDVSTSLYEWANDGLLNCLSGFPSGTVTRVERRTPVNTADLPSEQQGAGTFDYDGANQNDLYLLYISQERYDREAEVLENYDTSLLAQETVQALVQQVEDAKDLVLDGTDDAEGYKDQAAASATAASGYATDAANLYASMDAFKSTYESLGYFGDWGSIIEAPGTTTDYGDITA